MSFFCLYQNLQNFSKGVPLGENYPKGIPSEQNQG